MVKCVNTETCKARMERTDPKQKQVIVSVLKNFLVNAVRAVTDVGGEIEPENFDKVICTNIKDFFVVLIWAAESSLETKFAVVKPMFVKVILMMAEDFFMAKNDDLMMVRK